MRSIAAKKVFLGNGDSRHNCSIDITADGTIISLRDGFQEGQELYDAVCPGLINAHCHTELSHLKGLIPEGTGLPGFIHEVQQIRTQEPGVQEAAQVAALQELEASGVVGLGDICNSALNLQEKSSSGIKTFNFIELFGFSPLMANGIFESGLEKLKSFRDAGLEANIVPHAPYSVSLDLLQKIQQASSGLLSIHMQECAAEDELFIYKTGKLKEQLERFGIDLSTWENPGVSSLQTFLPYLSQQKFILVHTTQSSAADIAQAAKHTGAYFCTCPRANLYIEQQLPDYNQLLKQGAKMLIGTDSLASNHSLSIWEEMEAIAEHFPKLGLAQLLSWACQNGSEAFNWTDLGELKAGKRPGILALKANSNKALGYTLEKRII